MDEAQMIVSKRIMLIDDDPDDQLFFRDAVQMIRPDIQCDGVSSSQEAFSKLKQAPLPDFIFMDLNMPVMNGFDCLDYLKSHEKYKNIPVVIFTTSKNVKDISKSRQLGARWYLTKPDDFKLLCRKLKKILQNELPTDSYTI
jgi:CheY-like chemotaxis protein